MQINHDRSYIGQTSREFISRGYACESYHSLCFSYVYTAEQQAENGVYADQVGLGSEEWSVHIMDSARRRSEHMERVAALLAQNFKIYQYDDREGIEYGSNWDFFFWCNDFSRTMWNGLSGRDYSYFTLTFKEAYWHELRQRIYDRAMRILELFADDDNLEIAAQYEAVMDDAKIRQDAELAAPGMGGRACAYGGMVGRLEWNGERLLFRKKRSRTRIYRLSDAEVLALSWQLST